jgi:multiple sugar transport system substrate-binding protein
VSKKEILSRLSKPSLYFIILTAISVISLFLYISSPFSGSDNEDNIKKIYFADHISPVYQQLIDEFNADNKGNIEVIPVHLPFEKFTTNERKEILSRYLRSNDIVDIVSIDQIWVPRFAKWAEPLDMSFIEYVKDSLVSVALKSCYYQGKLVAMPIHLDVGIMYYRADIIKKLKDSAVWEKKLKASITWEDFIDLRKKTGSINNPFYIFQADDYEGLVCNFLELLQSQGRDLYENGILQLESPEAHVALNMLVDLVNTYNVSPPIVSELRENNGNNYFLNNNGIFLRGWPSFLKDFREDTIHSDITNKLELAALPHFKNGKPVYLFGGWNFMVSKYSNHKSEAVKFIKFMLSRRVQRRIFEARNIMPVIKSIYEDKNYMAKEKNLAYLYSLLDNGFYRPPIEDYTKVSDIISWYLYLAIKKELPVDTALKSASEKIRLGQVLIR